MPYMYLKYLANVSQKSNIDADLQDWFKYSTAQK